MAFKPALSRKAFFQYYLANSPIEGLTEDVMETELLALYCSCEDEICQGWSMLPREVGTVNHHFRTRYPKELITSERVEGIDRLTNAYTTEVRWANRAIPTAPIEFVNGQSWNDAKSLLKDIYLQLIEGLLAEPSTVDSVFDHFYRCVAFVKQGSKHSLNNLVSRTEILLTGDTKIQRRVTAELNAKK